MLRITMLKDPSIGGPTDILELTLDGKANWMNGDSKNDIDNTAHLASYPDNLLEILIGDKKNKEKYNLTPYL